MRISDWSSDVCSSDLKYTSRFSSTLALSWVLPVRPLDSEVAFNTDYYHTEKFGAENGQNLPGYDLVNARLALDEIAGSGFRLALGDRKSTRLTTGTNAHLICRLLIAQIKTTPHT